MPQNAAEPPVQEVEVRELPRSDSKIGRAIFTAILEMTANQPWLKERQNPLIDLIDECEKDDQQHLIFELLDRFIFLGADEFQHAIQAIADYIQITLSLGANNCAISASDNGKHSDSSQLVVYSLKAAKWNSFDWTTTSFVSSLSHLVESAGKGNLVLVDEFIGTGETAEKKVKWLRAELEKIGATPKIYFAVVAGMNAGIERVGAVVDGIFSAHLLRRGISDFYPAAEVQQRLDAMLELESRLGSEGRRGMLKKHSHGYKKSESLYSRANGNTPNNVFPVFWWEVRSNGSQRHTLLSCI